MTLYSFQQACVALCMQVVQATKQCFLCLNQTAELLKKIQNAPKVAILRSKIKKISGEGHCPLRRLLPGGEGTPSLHSTSYGARPAVGGCGASSLPPVCISWIRHYHQTQTTDQLGSTE